MNGTGNLLRPVKIIEVAPPEDLDPQFFFGRGKYYLTPAFQRLFQNRKKDETDGTTVQVKIDKLIADHPKDDSVVAALGGIEEATITLSAFEAVMDLHSSCEESEILLTNGTGNFGYILVSGVRWVLSCHVNRGYWVVDASPFMTFEWPAGSQFLSIQREERGA